MSTQNSNRDKSFRLPIHAACLAALCLLPTHRAAADVPEGYKGVPFHGVVQQIPGAVYPWRYDSAQVTKDMTWHYTGIKNGDYRTRTAGDGTVDQVSLRRNGPPDSIAPDARSLYTDTLMHFGDSNSVHPAWVEKGEWLKMTVNVAAEGDYRIDAVLGSDTKCSTVPCSGAEATGRLKMQFDFLSGTDSISTGNFPLPRTGYFHYYKFVNFVQKIHLKAGKQVFKWGVVDVDAFNNYKLIFTRLTATRVRYANAASRGWRDGAGPSTENAIKRSDARGRILNPRSRPGGPGETGFVRYPVSAP